LNVAFYCVADDRYFLGAVGTINSLRLLGHGEPIVLLDCGLTATQRELLAPQVTLVDAPVDAPPTLLKTIAPLERPAETLVLIDTDLIPTRPLTELIDHAAGGRVIAFRNDMDRWVAEWGDLLDLGPLPRRPYVAFALVCMDRGVGEEVLRLVADRQSRVEIERTMWGRDEPGYPLRYADQDVLNAVLASLCDPEQVTALDDRLAPVPPFDGLRVADAQSLRCVYPDGSEPYAVHHFIVKPWLERTYHGVYSQLLRRLLVGSDLAIRVPVELIPLRLRTGAFAYVERKRINAGQRLRYHVREPLTARLRSRGTGAGT
jgi:hypothetical protein